MKYVLVLMLGFVLHKGLEEIYDYHWMNGVKSDVCKNQYIIDIKDDAIDAPLTKRFRCTEKQMGAVYYLKYILIRPHWFSGNHNRWYY
jgi:hypothetical protein